MRQTEKVVWRHPFDELLIMCSIKSLIFNCSLLQVYYMCIFNTNLLFINLLISIISYLKQFIYFI